MDKIQVINMNLICVKTYNFTFDETKCMTCSDYVYTYKTYKNTFTNEDIKLKIQVDNVSNHSCGHIAHKHCNIGTLCRICHKK